LFFDGNLFQQRNTHSGHIRKIQRSEKFKYLRYYYWLVSMEVSCRFVDTLASRYNNISMGKLLGLKEQITKELTIHKNLY